MSKLNTHYWLETEHFFNNNKSHILSETLCHDSKSQTRLSRFEIFPESKMFRNRPTPFYTTQNSDLFITNKEEFNKHTCKGNPLQLSEDEHFTNFNSLLNLFLVNSHILKTSSFVLP